LKAKKLVHAGLTHLKTIGDFSSVAFSPEKKICSWHRNLKSGSLQVKQGMIAPLHIVN
jgi:hypothetical protein